MLTIFTTTKPFKGIIATLQENAIESWTRLHPRPQIILFGNDDGAEEIAIRLGLIHVPNIKKNERGTPLVNEMFEKAQQIANTKLVCYINADIILTNDFMQAVGFFSKGCGHSTDFMMVGQRWDYDLGRRLGFEQDWDKKLRAEVVSKGKIHAQTGIDYFVFPKGMLLGQMRPFAIGRVFWDVWLLYHIRSLNIPLIDASEVILPVHQNHDYSHLPMGRNDIMNGTEAKENERISGGFDFIMTIKDATHKLTRCPECGNLEMIVAPYNISIDIRCSNCGTPIRLCLRKLEWGNVVKFSDDVILWLQEIMRCIFNTIGSSKRIGLWGGGEHTRALLTLPTQLCHKNITVIFDNDPAKHGGNVFGIPICKFNEASIKNIDVIIISSRSGEDKIYEQISHLEGQRILIFRLYQDFERQKLKGFLNRKPCKIVIGASGVFDPGWIPTEKSTLNIVKESDWETYFQEGSIDAILSEHVWEHLTEEEGRTAAKLCFRYLKPGGYLRVAVPDGYHPDPSYIDHVRPGGNGPGADDHKMLYTYNDFGKLFERAGFSVRFLEYFDENGIFHYQVWDPSDGKIHRSSSYDSRNQGSPLKFTSLILDAYKK